MALDIYYGPERPRQPSQEAIQALSDGLAGLVPPALYEALAALNDDHTALRVLDALSVRLTSEAMKVIDQNRAGKGAASPYGNTGVIA